MKEFLSYVRRNWGVAPACAHCADKPPTALCGGCAQYAYCGESCQTLHWNASHRAECIGGGVKGDEIEKKNPHFNVGYLADDS
jgi:hypothetical protein